MLEWKESLLYQCVYHRVVVAIHDMYCLRVEVGQFSHILNRTHLHYFNAYSTGIRSGKITCSTMVVVPTFTFFTLLT